MQYLHSAGGLFLAALVGITLTQLGIEMLIPFFLAVICPLIILLVIYEKVVDTTVGKDHE